MQSEPGALRRAEKITGVERAANSFEVTSREWLEVERSEWTPG
jgi:hypothetical protein